MKKTYLILLSLCMAFFIACKQDPTPQTVIFETDMGGDIDDALALDLLFKGVDNGAIDLLGISLHRDNTRVADFADIMRCWYGHPDVAIGVNRRLVANTACVDYATAVCNMTDGDARLVFARSEMPEYENSVDMYRRLLASQPDNSVVVVSVGFSTTLADLLRSKADDFSPLSGRDLVARKVKYFSVMAGEFQQPDYKECNVICDVASAQYLFSNTPVPIVLTPFSLGAAIVYPYQSIANDFNWGEPHPMIEAYKWFAPYEYSSPSWDVLAAYYLMDPDSFILGERGDVSVNEAGITTFTPNPEGLVRCLDATASQREMIVQKLVSLITRKPKIYE